MENKLIRAEDLEADEQKYVASLRENGKHFCSGCLITGKHVLTAGQCIVRAFKYENTLFREISILLNGSVYSLEHFEHHANYNHDRRLQSDCNDFGIITVGLLLFFKNFNFEGNAIYE